jgi:hypothetical protein
MRFNHSSGLGASLTHFGHVSIMRGGLPRLMLNECGGFTVGNLLRVSSRRLESRFQMRLLIVPVVSAIISACCGQCQATLVAHWNFNSYDGDASTIASDSGSATITITGFPATNLNNFAGTLVNAVGVDPAGASLSLLSDANNLDFLEFTINLAGFENPIISFATQRSSLGFNNNSLGYSVNGGGSFATVFTGIVPASSYATQTFDFSSENALDGLPSVVFRYTFDGATDNSGNNRIDNLQINATAIPEGSAFLFGGFVCSAAGTVIGLKKLLRGNCR